MSYGSTGAKANANAYYGQAVTGRSISKHSRPLSNYNLPEDYEEQPVRMPMAQLADEIFNCHEYDLDSNDSERPSSKEDKFTKYYTGQQLELDLEDPKDMLYRYKQGIKRYERAHEKLALYALNWHYLMEDIEGDEVLTKMFNDIKLLRKLSGGTIL